ncbi:S41 family peptidase [Alkalibacillus haloalkaliphilus]|uniref:S41 family peptidase n=1 Tax=Alkalibacillus haloalkaliphilus TaxID=94136 RepID=UPI002936A118|nr:S41 family peptidase [Alkalibacillus haloalkaliphilus]MDV2582863.1 S41 family peptidase [Alkalibacillus haloalkaliphilus]
MSKKFVVLLVLVAFLVGGAISATAMNFLADEGEPQVKEEEQEQEEVEMPDDEVHSDVQEELGEEFTKIQQVISMLDEYYIHEVDVDSLYEGAIEGVVSSLDDPFSEYMDAEMTQQFQQQLESSFEGIGAEVTQREGHITIISPLADSPAEESGIRPNDRILAVDEESVEDYTVNEAVQLIRGEKGTDVVLTIDRPGEDEPFDISITRDTIPLVTVRPHVEETNGQTVGVLEIRSFGEGTAEEFAEELAYLEDEVGIDGLVLDVRGNPGGLFDAVENVLTHFMDGEETYVYTDRHDMEPEPSTLDGQGVKDYPISVLINEGSASASEILAAALNEVNGYEVVGETTFGKGTVQQTMPLDGGMLKMTVFDWLTPDGNRIEGQGVDPTVEQRQPEYFYSTLIQSEEPLEYDMNNSEVRKLQLMLEGLGYEIDRTDGYFDDNTVEVVEQFQSDEGLDVTGVVDEPTEERIEELILDAVMEPENDLQLQRAIEVIFE